MTNPLIGESSNRSPPPQVRLLTIEEVLQIVNKSRSSLYRWIKQGYFPEQYKVGPNNFSSVWSSVEVELWVNEVLNINGDNDE